MAISENTFNAANQQGAAMQARHALATAVRFDRRRKKLILTLDSGLELAFAPHLAQGLQDASADDLAEVHISPSGLGLHFPALDADLYVPALLDGLLGSSRWIAAQNGRSGGQVQSAAKSHAARLNGARGGRPKRQEAV